MSVVFLWCVYRQIGPWVRQCECAITESIGAEALLACVSFVRSEAHHRLFAVSNAGRFQ